MLLRENEMSESMLKFYEDLYFFEFGEDNIPPNRNKFNQRLSKALNWKNYRNLYTLCYYLGWVDLDDATIELYKENDNLNIPELLKSIEGCKILIRRDIK